MSEKKAYEGPKKEFKPIPKGEYLMRLIKIEEKKTKNGKGVMLDCRFEVCDQSNFKGNLVFGNFLVEHTSEKAQEIGNKMLNYYLNAVGVDGGMSDLGEDRTQIQNHMELPFVASVGIEEPKEYTAADGSLKMSPARNKIFGFKAR